MSIYATTWAYEQRIKNSGAKFILVALADYADASGYCYPGQSTLAEMTSLDERTVRAHLKWLEDNNFIRRSRAHDDRGRRTSDDIHLLAPPERLRPAKPRPEESPACQNDKRKKTARSYRKKTPPEKSPAYPLVDKVEPSDTEPSDIAAQPPASPHGVGDAGAAEDSPHRRGMAYLHERCGPIPNPSAQGAALKWLLSHYTFEQCCACMDALLEDDWRKTAVSWLTVKKEIGTWLARKEKADGGNGRPEKDGGRDSAQAGARRTSYAERRASSRATARRQYEDDSI